MNMDLIQTRSKNKWNEFNSYCPRDNIKYDDWLDTFLEEIDSCKTWDVVRVMILYT